MKKLKELKKRISKGSRLNTILFFIIVIVTVTFSMGYSLLNENLSIGGEAAYRVIADIRITSLTRTSLTDGAKESYESKYYNGKYYNSKYSINTINVGVELPNKDSSITYEVEVTNLGNINQWVNNLISSNTNENIVCVIDGLEVQEDIIYSPDVSDNNIKTFTITFSYKDSIKEGTDALPTGDGTKLSTIITFEFEALEKYTITYDLDGGTVTSNPENYTKADTITLNNPTKKGYEFLGWTGTGLETITKNVTIPKLSEGDRNYVANWEALPWTFAINSTPSNATVTLTSGTQTITGEGEASITVYAGETINWSVTLEHYETQSGEQLMLEDVTKDISLTSYIETIKVESSYDGRGYTLQKCSNCDEVISQEFDTELYLIKYNEDNEKYEFVNQSAWSSAFVNTSSSTINGSSGFGGVLSYGIATLAVSHIGNHGVMYTGPINLTDVSSIEFSYVIYDSLYKTNSTQTQYGVNTTYVGVTTDTGNNTTFTKSSSVTYTRSSSSDAVKTGTITIDTPDLLTGEYYIKVYVKHSHDGDKIITANTAYTGFKYIKLIYKQ